jgi:hypothetical protein
MSLRAEHRGSVPPGISENGDAETAVGAGVAAEARNGLRFQLQRAVGCRT